MSVTTRKGWTRVGYSWSDALFSCAIDHDRWPESFPMYAIPRMRAGRNAPRSRVSWALRSTRVARSSTNPFFSVVEYFSRTQVKLITFSLCSGLYADWADPMLSPGDLQRIARVPGSHHQLAALQRKYSEHKANITNFEKLSCSFFVVF